MSLFRFPFVRHRNEVTQKCMRHFCSPQLDYLSVYHSLYMCVCVCGFEIPITHFVLSETFAKATILKTTEQRKRAKEILWKSVCVAHSSINLCWKYLLDVGSYSIENRLPFQNHFEKLITTSKDGWKDENVKFGCILIQRMFAQTDVEAQIKKPSSQHWDKKLCLRATFSFLSCFGYFFSASFLVFFSIIPPPSFFRHLKLPYIYFAAERKRCKVNTISFK